MLKKYFIFFNGFTVNLNMSERGLDCRWVKKLLLIAHGDINALGSSEKGAVFNVILPVNQIMSESN